MAIIGGNPQRFNGYTELYRQMTERKWCRWCGNISTEGFRLWALGGEL